MKYKEFIDGVADRIALPRDDAKPLRSPSPAQLRTR